MFWVCVLDWALPQLRNCGIILQVTDVIVMNDNRFHASIARVTPEQAAISNTSTWNCDCSCLACKTEGSLNLRASASRKSTGYV